MLLYIPWSVAILLKASIVIIIFIFVSVGSMFLILCDQISQLKFN